jgi:hypothetical protein
MEHLLRPIYRGVLPKVRVGLPPGTGLEPARVHGLRRVPPQPERFSTIDRLPHTEQAAKLLQPAIEERRIVPADRSRQNCFAESSLCRLAEKDLISLGQLTDIDESVPGTPLLTSLPTKPGCELTTRRRLFELIGNSPDHGVVGPIGSPPASAIGERNEG